MEYGCPIPHMFTFVTGTDQRKLVVSRDAPLETDSVPSQHSGDFARTSVLQYVKSIAQERNFRAPLTTSSVTMSSSGV